MRILGQNRGYVAGALIIGVGMLGSLLVVATGPSASPVEQVEKAWPVSSIVADPARLAPRFSTFARVESNQFANLRAAVDSPVAKVEVRVGDTVRANDILIALSDTDQQLALRATEADLAAAEAALGKLDTEQARLQGETAYQQELADIAHNKLARYQKLFDDGMVAQSLFDEVRREASERAIALVRHQAELADLPHRRHLARAQLEQTRAQVDQARLDLERTLIRAPFAGPILEISAGPGDHLRGMPLLRMADADGFELKATLPDRYGERLRNQLALGHTIMARSDAIEGEFPLVRVSGAIRSGQGGLDGYFALPNELAQKMELGRVVNLEVELPPEPDVVAVPLPALFENDRVYRIDNGRLTAVTVERVGEYRDAGQFSVLIRSPELTAGAQLLTTQLPNAISGLLVDPGPTLGGAALAAES